jgi:hypothetical protein
MPATGDPTIALPEWELQQDVYSILNADSTIKTTLAASVYNEVPDTPSFPYLEIGQIIDNPQYHKSGALPEVVATIHIYTTYRGDKLTNQLATAAVTALTGGSYSLTGFTVLICSFDNYIIVPVETYDQDRTVRHGILYMRYLIQ